MDSSNIDHFSQMPVRYEKKRKKVFEKVNERDERGWVESGMGDLMEAISHE